MSDVTIMVPTRDRPRELRRLLHFLRGVGNRYPVLILDGSRSELEALNAAMTKEFSFARHRTYGIKSHMGVRCADGLRQVDTPYVVFCADDDFVFPDALDECARFLGAHVDYSVALGRVFSLSYFKQSRFFRNGILLQDPLRFVGYMAHERFLQRALYYFAYTHLGSTPLFYGLRRTGTALEAFSKATETMKYSGVELLSNTVALIRGKVSVLRRPFGLRDYATPTITAPIRHDPDTYLARADLDYMRPFFSALLAEQERMPAERADEHIDLFLTHWPSRGWTPWAPAAPEWSGLGGRLRLTAALLRSMYRPASLAAQFELPRQTLAALMAAQRDFVGRQ